MDLKIGLDIGSTAIKVVFTDGDNILWRGQSATRPGQESVSRALMGNGLAELGLAGEAIVNVSVTGYGKKLFGRPGAVADEISANAAGLFRLSGGKAGMIVNIGGQDMKVIFLDARGRLSDFRMNDKCAAGTGRFFELAARILDTSLEDFGELSRRAGKTLELNSTCAVFAESEIVSLLASGTPREEIIKALHASIARRASALIGKEMNHPIWLDGGPAQNPGLVEALEDELLTEVLVLEHPQYTVAYGAILVAR
ncbi:MAG: acyl-CoA dehydratase activase [Candidatus Accumulibacter sp.]|jgi:predicted CoA-substrate-specific enzyme activase|nr:acyl-CoA dehydratase activase [Accumulibacter sp.]